MVKKGVWKPLKSLSGTNKPRVRINEITTENEVVSDESAIANELNEYFVNILEQIGNNNDAGVDFENTKLKNVSTNSLPNHWKKAKVTPLHKGGARNDVNSYRSISVLLILSKILEKHVASSLSVFLRDNNLLYELQSAFRSGHSTETALIRLTDQILKNTDNDEVTGLVFIDFRKAFDVIDHELLLTKLFIYGATPSSVGWFKSYLSERKQFISLGKTTSKQLTVKQGVPLGSILSPVLFLLFVNDMPLHVQKSAMDIYADDITLLSSNWKPLSQGSLYPPYGARERQISHLLALPPNRLFVISQILGDT